MNGIRVCLGIALVAMPGSAQSQTDFSGKWEFNPSLSKNIGMMAQMKLTAKVKQTSDKLIVTSSTAFNGNFQESDLRLDLTGKTVQNRNPMEALADTVSRWDGKKLVTTWTSPGSVAGTTSVRIETRFLSDDGHTMTVESKRGNAPAIVMVYERK
jgi:hypothetical protein